VKAVLNILCFKLFVKFFVLKREQKEERKNFNKQRYGLTVLMLDFQLTTLLNPLFKLSHIKTTKMLDDKTLTEA
jgi:hypothetical protein